MTTLTSPSLCRHQPKTSLELEPNIWYQYLGPRTWYGTMLFTIFYDLILSVIVGRDGAMVHHPIEDLGSKLSDGNIVSGCI